MPASVAGSPRSISATNASVEELLAARANELADGLGNLVNRTITLVDRFRPGGLRPSTAPPGEAEALLVAARSRTRSIGRANGAIADALDRFDFRAATDSLWKVVSEANRFVSATRPWELAKAEREGNRAASGRLDAVLVLLLDACVAITDQFQPFLPDAAARIEHALERRDPALGRTLFRKADVVWKPNRER